MNPILVKTTTFVLALCLASTGAMIFLTGEALADDNYTLAGETVNKGSSINPTYRNAEDAQFNQLIEGDQYTDTNFSASSEDMTYGTAGGGAFPGSLDDDDGTRRTYTEENTLEEPPASYDLYLYPNGDVLAEWAVAAPGGDHYLNVDETTEGSDGATSYVESNSNGDMDRFAMADMSDPGTGYDINVTVFAVHYKGSSQPNAFQAGIRIGTTDYGGIDVSPTNGEYVNTSSSAWTINPATTSEWTYSEINTLVAYITSDDTSPNVRCSQVGLKISISFTAVEEYQLDAEITFSSVGETGQTTGFYVFCQGYRIGTEDFDIYAYDFVSPGWNKKDTIDQASDTDYNFALTANEYDSVTDSIIIRILDTVLDDDCQCIVYLDILKVMRIEIGYALDVELTSSSIPATGDIQLNIKGYTSTETFQLDVWNYDLTAWDTNELQITDTENDWQTMVDLDDDDHRSGTTVLIRFVDTVSQTSDTTKDTLYLDVVWITVVILNNAPYFTSTPDYTSHNNTLYYYNANAVDDDGYPPDLVYDLEGNITDFASIVPSTGVVQGTPSAIGDYWMNISVTDGIATVWQNSSIHIYTNAPSFVTTAITEWQNGTTYQYNAQASDPELEALTFDLEGNGTSIISIPPPDGYYCLLSGAITNMGWWYLNLSVTDGTNIVWQNYTLTALNSAPYFITSPELNAIVNMTYQYSPNATDNNFDVLIYSIDASPSETTDWLSFNVSTGTIEGTPTIIGEYDVNLSVMDTLGVTTWQNYSITVDLSDSDVVSLLALIIALCFCFGIMLAGFKEKILMLLAGFVWIACGVAIYIDYGDLFMYMSVGLGSVLLIKGAIDLAD